MVPSFCFILSEVRDRRDHDIGRYIDLFGEHQYFFFAIMWVRIDVVLYAKES